MQVVIARFAGSRYSFEPRRLAQGVLQGLLIQSPPQGVQLRLEARSTGEVFEQTVVCEYDSQTVSHVEYANQFHLIGVTE